MGSGTFDAGAYRTYSSTTVGKTVDEVFTSRTMSASLNPHGVKVRESRDSADNPNSTPVIVALDDAAALVKRCRADSNENTFRLVFTHCDQFEAPQTGNLHSFGPTRTDVERGPSARIPTWNP